MEGDARMAASVLRHPYHPYKNRFFCIYSYRRTQSFKETYNPSFLSLGISEVIEFF
jgi:hypothetical protein